MASLQIRIDDQLREQAQAVAQGMGLDLTAAVRLLVGLEKLGLIPTAAAYITAMENAGRVIKDKTHPLDIPGDGPTSWVPRP